MKLWEAVVLVLGGLWLIGQKSKQSPAHPLNMAVPDNSVALSTVLLPSNTMQGPAAESSNGLNQPVIAGEGFSPTPPPNITVGGGVTRGAVLPTHSSSSYAGLSSIQGTGATPPNVIPARPVATQPITSPTQFRATGPVASGFPLWTIAPRS